MSLRQTGRTSRMLRAAQRLQAGGRAVYVVAANQAECVRLRRILPENSGIKVETPESMGRFDWEHLQVRGMHPNCAVLVDHYTIESRLARMLRELHAYDQPTREAAADAAGGNP